jgi:hypothetical protein
MSQALHHRIHHLCGKSGKRLIVDVIIGFSDLQQGIEFFRAIFISLFEQFNLLTRRPNARANAALIF